MGHHDAVKYLSALRGTIRFDLENNIEADIDEVCDMDTRLYQFHISESESAAENPKKENLGKVLTYPGKAKDVRSTSTVSLQSQSKPNSIESSAESKPKVTDLPKVHAFASPAKANKNATPKTSEL